MHELSHEIGIHGNTDLLNNPLAVALNSRQSKTPFGNDPWVKNTVAAVQAASDAGFTLICSLGMNTWELSLWAAAEKKCKLIILIPSEKRKSQPAYAQEIAEDFNIDPANCLWLSLPPTPGSRGAKGWWEQRDSIAFSLAHRLYPICIRPGGNWDSLLHSPEAAAKEIMDEYKAPYPKAPKSIPILPKDFKVPEIRPWTYLTHWTRRCYGPWPGETSSDYYRALAASGDDYPRSAYATLIRILRELRIRGSSARIRGGADVVAFTAIPLDEALGLMKWRGRFARPTFEPYGICVDRKAAYAAGIKPVEYLPQGLASSTVPEALQQGFGRGFWPAEAEWRAVGDVNLAEIDAQFIRIIVPTEAEVLKISHLSSFKILPIEKLYLFMPD